jgi:hypothetical protein
MSKELLANFQAVFAEIFLRLDRIEQRIGIKKAPEINDRRGSSE